MFKVALIVGARPNFIKAYPIYNELISNGIDVNLIHTGQHYDENMSDIFFKDLDFPKPNIILTLRNKTPSSQISEIMCELENIFIINRPELVIVCGDVNSTLAGALCANKMGIKLCHIESGLRSGDKTMPEEINRILVDNMSDIMFTTEESGSENLQMENNKCVDVYMYGNTMIDTLIKYYGKAKEIKTEFKDYVLITLHRPDNVDNKEKLEEIINDINILSEDEIVVFPIHPRTRKMMKRYNLSLNDKVLILEPQGYLNFLSLMINSKYIITDSGGIQEEATFLNKLCFTLRESTERPITLINNGGTNTLISRIHKTKEMCKTRVENKTVLSDGNASKRIVRKIKEIMELRN